MVFFLRNRSGKYDHRKSRSACNAEFWFYNGLQALCAGTVPDTQGKKFLKPSKTVA